MSELRLMSPTAEYAEQIDGFRAEMLEAESDFAGCGGLKHCNCAADWLDELELLKGESTCPNGLVPSSSFLAVCKGRVVGVIELRHRIDTPILSSWGGHIGFSVRPSERRRGYAKEMLRQLLSVCRARGMGSVLVTCGTENIASERTITANGGVFDSEITVDGRKIKRFWIKL